MKKQVSLGMAAIMTASMVSVMGTVPVMADDVNITIFNSKMEIQEAMEEMAAEYTEKTGVGVEIYYSNDTVSAHMATRYASDDPYTISMVDAKDVYSLGAEHAIDLSDQDWVNDTDYEVTVDFDKVGVKKMFAGFAKLKKL